MNKEKISAEERKKTLKKDLKEGIDGFRELFIAAIALTLTIIEAIPWNKASKSLDFRKTNYKNSKSNRSLSLFKGDTQRNDTNPVEVSVEVEPQQIKNIMPKIISNLIYPLLATVSTAAFVTGVIRIDPLINWARIQNECIEKTSSLDGASPASLSNKVMRCNGGHL